VLDAAFLIPAFPLAGFLAILLAGRRLGEPAAGWLATLAMGGSFAASAVVFAGLLGEPESQRRHVQTLWEWVPAGELSVDVGLLVDPLSITMALFVSGVGALIHLYSIAYMHGDEHFARFFVYLNLFAFSMLMLVLGDNMLLTFLGWEGVGACSYLLISFWFSDEANASAGKKAFVTNRIGDWGFMVAMFAVFTTIGSIRYLDIFGNAGAFGETTATVVTVLLLVAAAGKSAQIPLYVWLPDAMAGPTPVSALIHAATMVTAGVYLLVRVNPLIAEASSWAPGLIAWVGVLTALLAASIAIAQNDIKKVLAYSTISQLGYMFLAVGSGAYVAAVFHMVTHAFFKALLFLGSGSVIHGMHHEQDMRRFGGLRKLMPITSATFIVGWLAIAGVPPFSGFWSKDEILAYAYQQSPILWALGLLTAVLTAFYMSRQVLMTFYGRLRFADIRETELSAIRSERLESAEQALAAAQSAADSAAQAADAASAKSVAAKEKLALRESELAAVAADDDKAHKKAARSLERARSAVEPAETAAAEAADALQQAQAATSAAQARLEAATAAGDISADDIADDELPDAVRARREWRPRESPWQMTLPLVVLAGLAVVAGAINLPFAKDLHFLGDWLKPSTFGNDSHLESGAVVLWSLAIVAVLGAAVGIGAALAVYAKGRYPAERVELEVLARGWHYDEAVSGFMGGPGRRAFDRIAWFDSAVVDGAVNGIARLVRNSGGRMRRLQSGLLRSYATLMAVGAIALIAWFLIGATT